MPEIGFPARSVTRTRGAVGALVWTVAACAPPALALIRLGLPCWMVSVNAGGRPGRPPTEAVALPGPATLPRVSVSTANPPASVMDVVLESVAPLAIQFTVTPETPFDRLSVTWTTRGASFAPMVSLCASPLTYTRFFAAPEMPVATKITESPPSAVARSLFCPVVGPRCQLVTVARPNPLVLIADVGVTTPPPATTANVTAIPLTGLPNWSVTFADGATGTAESTNALWLSPAALSRATAAPWVAVAPNETGDPLTPFRVAVAPGEPAVVPRTRIALATPELSVTDEGVIDPPPDTPQVTVTPGTGLAYWSVTVTV